MHGRIIRDNTLDKQIQKAWGKRGEDMDKILPKTSGLYYRSINISSDFDGEYVFCWIADDTNCRIYSRDPKWSKGEGFWNQTQVSYETFSKWEYATPMQLAGKLDARITDLHLTHPALRHTTTKERRTEETERKFIHTPMTPGGYSGDKLQPQNNPVCLPAV